MRAGGRESTVDEQEKSGIVSGSISHLMCESSRKTGLSRNESFSLGVNSSG